MAARRAGGGERGRNLFPVDEAAILATLREANAALLARAEALAEALARVPACLADDALVDRARTYRGQVAAARAEVRQARLDDGRPFRDAQRVVEGFFAAIEARLRAVEEEVVRRLTAAALAAQPAPAPGGHAASGPEDPAPAADRAGADEALGQAVAAAPTGAAICLRWEVEGFDRDALDLEALRMFLTDHALLAACRRHLEENGPNALPGAAYRQVADR